jgi:hypothetical protein
MAKAELTIKHKVQWCAGKPNRTEEKEKKVFVV